ncbi:DUF3426 domain-containing protein [Cupriavidus sp.]|uniref:DUF3426 domain-containing protein n=1 Tax=Cupriavidus sp. TaxID=1873897 RepID=UPI0031CE0BAC
MAAAKLVTRCPACRTAFRLVADQLRLRQGLVRCGQCDTVFDAREHLIEVPAPAATSASSAPSATSTASTASPAAAVTMAAALAHAEQTQATARARESDAPFHPGFDPGYEVPALDSPTTMMSEPPPDEVAPAQETDAARVAGEGREEGREEGRQEARHDGRQEARQEAHQEATAARGAEPVADAEGADVEGADVDVEPDLPADLEAGLPPAVSPAAAEAAIEAPTKARTEASAEAPVVGTEMPGAEGEPVSNTSATSSATASATASADSAPEAEPPLTDPPASWPTLNHSAFDDEPVRTPSPAARASQASHSSLDPAAAFAPTNPSGMPPYGAYSAKASWPPLRPADAPSTRPMADTGAATPQTSPTEESPDADPVSGDEHAEAAPDVSDAAHESADALPTPGPFPQADPVPSASGFLRAEDPADPEAEAWAAQAKDVIEHDLGVTLRDGTPDAVARETATRHWLNQPGAAARSPSASAGTAASGPVFAPDFLRHTREREQARAPGVKVSVPGNRRTWMRAAVIVLGLGILVQGVYLARSQIAGSMPVLRPLLEAACAPLGCDVPPWRDLDALRIDSSQLQKQDEASDVYLLAVTLRNQGRATTALPAIELVMTDLQDQLLLRRVLLPAEYLEPVQRGFAATGLRAGSELPVRVRFRTQQAAANYRVLIFYP